MTTVTNLRNPSLKKRHWDVLFEAINFTPDAENPLNLGRLFIIDYIIFIEKNHFIKVRG